MQSPLQDGVAILLVTNVAIDRVDRDDLLLELRCAVLSRVGYDAQNTTIP